jgi:hypothetical protein
VPPAVLETLDELFDRLGLIAGGLKGTDEFEHVKTPRWASFAHHVGGDGRSTVF